MSDDIVARLRDCTCVPHGELCRESADEIERLRDERAARIDEIVRNTYEFRETLTELRRDVETLTDERDYARRLLCSEIAMDRGGQVSAVEIAKARGWDCFKEGGK